MFFRKKKEIERLNLEIACLRTSLKLLENTPPIMRDVGTVVPIGAKAIVFPDEPEKYWKDRLINVLAGSLEPAIAFYEDTQRSNGLKEVSARLEVVIRRDRKCNT